MRKIWGCSAAFNDMLTLWQGVFKPDKISSRFEPEQLSEINGFNIVYIDEDETEYYFIGDIANIEQVKHLFKPNIKLELWQDKKFAVSYRDGKIFDVRPILSYETWQPVKTKEELLEVYKQKTGFEIPTFTDSKKDSVKTKTGKKKH